MRQNLYAPLGEKSVSGLVWDPVRKEVDFQRPGRLGQRSDYVAKPALAASHQPANYFSLEPGTAPAGGYYKDARYLP